jgi:hypothetical protein
VVISAIVVGIVVAVGWIITNALNDKATSVGNCIKNSSGGSQSC